MTNEEILRNIEAAIKFNKETKQKIDDTLCHAVNSIQNIDKKLKSEYERGIKDAWDLACKICRSPAFGGFETKQLDLIFGKRNIVEIMNSYSYESTKNKMDEYLAKKKTEEETIIRGDVVVCTRERINGTISYTGIFLKEHHGHYYILVSENEKDVDTHVLKTDLWRIAKLDGHVDLD